MNHAYLPEGRLSETPENARLLTSPAGLRQAMAEGTLLEAMVTRCDAEHNLRLLCGPFEGFMPRQEVAIGIEDGSAKEIAILSRVGKPTCFVVTDLQERAGRLTPILSRRQAQLRTTAWLMERQPGDVIPARVTHLESFGAFVDVGCGVPSLLSIEHISISRVPHPVYRFTIGQELSVLVTGVDPNSRRLSLSHRELLGSWRENAALFQPGETVTGYVRGTKDYGVFVELTPNLSGLAEPRPGLHEGDRVSVFLKSIAPERMKIKLMIIEPLPPTSAPDPFRYFFTGPRLEHWRYAPEGCEKGAEWDAAARS